MAWTFRILLERKDHAYSSFVTLTYADIDLPEKLDYEDITRFLKRLRRSSRTTVRFFCVGEYGGKTNRPHWHLILFGVPPLGKGQHHIKQWRYGHVHTGDVTPESAAYTARYSLKSGKNGHKFIVNQSRKPGLGLRRLQEIGASLAEQKSKINHMPYWFKHGKRMYPLDQYARAKVTDAYLSEGGLIEDLGPNPAALELESRISLITGDPFTTADIGADLINIDKRHLDNGKI